VWKLDGLGANDIRRPLTPTGTSVSLPWPADDAEPNAETWVTPDETSDDIVALHETAARFAGDT
jgi:hypothetical protein